VKDGSDDADVCGGGSEGSVQPALPRHFTASSSFSPCSAESQRRWCSTRLTEDEAHGG
jgi:hypothetical protein